MVTSISKKIFLLLQELSKISFESLYLEDRKETVIKINLLQDILSISIPITIDSKNQEYSSVIGSLFTRVVLSETNISTKRIE